MWSFICRYETQKYLFWKQFRTETTSLNAILVLVRFHFWRFGRSVFFSFEKCLGLGLVMKRKKKKNKHKYQTGTVVWIIISMNRVGGPCWFLMYSMWRKNRFHSKTCRSEIDVFTGRMLNKKFTIFYWTRRQMRKKKRLTKQFVIENCRIVLWFVSSNNWNMLIKNAQRWWNLIHRKWPAKHKCHFLHFGVSNLPPIDHNQLKPISDVSLQCNVVGMFFFIHVKRSSQWISKVTAIFGTMTGSIIAIQNIFPLNVMSIII